MKTALIRALLLLGVISVAANADYLYTVTYGTWELQAESPEYLTFGQPLELHDFSVCSVGPNTCNELWITAPRNMNSSTPAGEADLAHVGIDFTLNYINPQEFSDLVPGVYGANETFLGNDGLASLSITQMSDVQLQPDQPVKASTFVYTPEPSSWALLGMGILIGALAIKARSPNR